MPPGDARSDSPLNIFFDVDDTLITWDNRLRPCVHEVFQQLKQDGHAIFIWSGVGVRHDVVDRHDLRRYLSGLFRKPLYEFRERLAEFTHVEPHFVVDDYPQIVAALGGIQVRPPIPLLPDDREMWRAYDAFAAFVRRHFGPAS